LNASDIIPELNGLVDASIVASGTIKEPNAKLNARGYRFAYQDWALEDFDIQASYQDGEAKLQIPQSRWKNQALELSGNFVPKTMSFLAELKTNPINTIESRPCGKGLSDRGRGHSQKHIP
jgi:autotransporter translocation and assembly factor TamB